MLKILKAAIIVVIALFVLFKVVGPKLISENSDAAVIVGAACIIAGLYYLCKTMYQYLNEEE